MKKTIITLTAVIASFLVTSCGKWEEAVDESRQDNQIEGTDLYRSLSSPASKDIPLAMNVDQIFDTAREVVYKDNGKKIFYYNDGFKVERIMTDIYKFTMNVRKHDKGIAEANRSRTAGLPFHEVEKVSKLEHPGPYTITFDVKLGHGGLSWEVSNLRAPGLVSWSALLK